MNFQIHTPDIILNSKKKKHWAQKFENIVHPVRKLGVTYDYIKRQQSKIER